MRRYNTEEKKQLRAAIYIRVSTTGQAEEGYSLETQEHLLRDYCKARKIQVIGIYADEGISAKDVKHRPEMQRLLCDATQDKFNLVVVWKLTRFTRSLNDLVNTCDLFAKHGVDLISYSESFDCSTPSGKMVRNILGTIAQFEREVIGENVKIVMQRKAELGHRTCSEVLGYDLDGKTSLKVNNEESKYVQFCFSEYLKCKNLSEVAAEARRLGFRGKRGKTPTASAILVIITRPIYCGYNSFHGRLFKGNHQSIVSVEEFNRVQKLLKKQGKLIGRKRISELYSLNE